MIHTDPHEAGSGKFLILPMSKHIPLQIVLLGLVALSQYFVFGMDKVHASMGGDVVVWMYPQLGFTLLVAAPYLFWLVSLLLGKYQPNTCWRSLALGLAVVSALMWMLRALLMLPSK